MAGPKTPIAFEHLGLGSVLARNRLTVPLNQREYSWERKHVVDLLTDFSRALTKKSYFLGTIVLTTTQDDALEVIDGQQRLATTTILIAAIRDRLISLNEDMLVNSIEQDFLFKVIREKKEKVPRLTLNHQDKDYFIARILERPKSPARTNVTPRKQSHELLDEAAKHAAVHVEQILGPHKTSNHVPVLNDWLAFIEHSALAIILIVPDDLNAYVMFETLNDRGLKTSQADLVKNYLFGEANGRLQDAQLKWATMNGLLDGLGIDEITLTYLRHLAISLFGHTREKEVLERIKTNVSGERPAIDFLDSLAENANDYVAIMTPTHAKWNQYHPRTARRRPSRTGSSSGPCSRPTGRPGLSCSNDSAGGSPGPSRASNRPARRRAGGGVASVVSKTLAWRSLAPGPRFARGRRVRIRPRNLAEPEKTANAHPRRSSRNGGLVQEVQPRRGRPARPLSHSRPANFNQNRNSSQHQFRTGKKCATRLPGRRYGSGDSSAHEGRPRAGRESRRARSPTTTAAGSGRFRGMRMFRELEPNRRRRSFMGENGTHE